MSEEQPALPFRGFTATGISSRTVVLKRPIEVAPPDTDPFLPADEPLALIPRPEAPLPAGHRRCPTVPGDLQALVRHTIAVADCEERQCEGYHKCFQCVHRDRSPFRAQELPPVENRTAKRAMAQKNGRAS